MSVNSVTNELEELAMESLVKGICRGVTKAGNPCTVSCNGTGYCLLHNPDPVVIERRIEFARRGGQASGRSRRQKIEQARALEPIRLRSSEDALRLVEDSINDLRLGRIDIARARVQIKASTVVLQHAATKEVAQKLTYLEAKLREYGLEDGDSWKQTFDGLREARRLARGRQGP